MKKIDTKFNNFAQQFFAELFCAVFVFSFVIPQDVSAFQQEALPVKSSITIKVVSNNVSKDSVHVSMKEFNSADCSLQNVSATSNFVQDQPVLNVNTLPSCVRLKVVSAPVNSQIAVTQKQNNIFSIVVENFTSRLKSFVSTLPTQGTSPEIPLVVVVSIVAVFAVGKRFYEQGYHKKNEVVFYKVLQLSELSVWRC